MTAAVQFAVIPNFTRLSFRDNEAAQAALRHVLVTLHKKEENPNSILSVLSQQFGCNTVGDLRALTDQQWKELEIPAMARIYLKYCVRQSSKKKSQGTFMEKLQDDFNYGQPFDMSLYKNHLAMLTQMGFSTEQSMEALVITENKGIEGALELLFQQESAAIAERREEAAKRLGRRVAVAEDSKLSDTKLKQALVKAQAQLVNEKSSREILEAELRKLRETNRANTYREFLRGITAGESITITAFNSYQRFRKQYRVDDHQHADALGQLGLTSEQFTSMRHFEQKEKRDSECVVCLDNTKDHVCMPCMHVSLCENCAPDFVNAKCPMCSKKVTAVKRIYL